MLFNNSQTWTPHIIEDIHAKAQLGRYRLRGFSTNQRVPHFDDLVFLPSGLTRIPLEGYKETCDTTTILGKKSAKYPIKLDTPVYISGMSYGALSKSAKIALAKGAAMVGSASCTGDGGMLPEERQFAKVMIFQMNASRYGIDPNDMVNADGVEIVVGQGAKPGTGGLLMGQKVSEIIGLKRDLPVGIDQRSATRHPEWLGPDDLAIFIELLREITDWKVPIQIKLPACRVKDDVKLAAKAGADIIVVDGMQAGTGASAEVLLNHTAIPTMPAIVQAREALEELGLTNEISLVASGGIRNGADMAKALALGADAVAIGQAAMIALNCNRELPGITNFVKEIGVEAGFCNKCNTGKCPVGITTQEPKLEKRLNINDSSNQVANFLNSMTMEAGIIARSLGKSNVHSLEPEDLVALSIEASAMAKVPLAGTNKIFGI